MAPRSRLLPLVLIAIAIAGETRALAQGAPAVDPLTAYHQQALGARFSFWSGLKLARGSTVVPLGFFGGGRESIFAGSEAALSSIDSFRKLRIGGTVLWATGLAVLIAEIMLLAADQDLLIDGEKLRPLFYGMLIPGAAVGIAGGIMMQSANGFLSDAIQQHNDDLYRRLSSGRVAGSRRLMLSVSRPF